MILEYVNFNVKENPIKITTYYFILNYKQVKIIIIFNGK
jgi:hypothetical protein